MKTNDPVPSYAEHGGNRPIKPDRALSGRKSILPGDGDYLTEKEPSGYWDLQLAGTGSIPSHASFLVSNLHGPDLLNGLECGESQQHALPGLGIGQRVVSVTLEKRYPGGHLLGVTLGAMGRFLFAVVPVNYQGLKIDNLSHDACTINGAAFLGMT